MEDVLLNASMSLFFLPHKTKQNYSPTPLVLKLTQVCYTFFAEFTYYYVIKLLFFRDVDGGALPFPRVCVLCVAVAAPQLYQYSSDEHGLLQLGIIIVWMACLSVWPSVRPSALFQCFFPERMCLPYLIASSLGRSTYLALVQAESTN